MAGVLLFLLPLFGGYSYCGDIVMIGFICDISLKMRTINDQKLPSISVGRCGKGMVLLNKSLFMYVCRLYLFVRYAYGTSRIIRDEIIQSHFI